MPKFVMMPPLDDLRREWARRLADILPEYDVVAPETDAAARWELAEADAAFGWIPPESLKKARRLRWLQNPDAGPFPGYFYPEMIDHPVMVCNPRGIYFDHISHHVMMFVLALSRGLPYYVDAQRASIWDKDARKSRYVNLPDSTALIVGVGGIGHETARLCHEFGMEVLGVDSRPEYALQFVEMHRPRDLDKLIPKADFVITTTPHTPDTEGMWNKAMFKAMKNTAFFINVGRGRTTSLDDLTEAIETREIGGCGLDVYEIEPLPSTHPLWTLPNVLLTPHVAVRDAENLPERRFQVILENAKRFAAGKRLKNIVDKAAWY